MTAMNDLPAEDLYRREAREHQLRGEESLRRIEISPPWTWALLWALLAALVTAIVFATLGSIEVNTRAIGILRPATGVRVLVSQVSGTVASVPRHSGEAVAAGDVVLQIDSPQLQGQLLAAEREAGLLESDYREVSQQQDRLHQRQLAETQTRIAQLKEQIESERTSIGVLKRRLEAMRSLESSSVVSRFSVLDAQEAVAQAERRLGGSQQSLALAHQELAALASQREAELWQRRQSLDNALSRRDSMRLESRQTRVVAPQNGVIEALVVKPGDDVRPGQTLGKLIPSGAPLEVVSFLPEKDRAFVRVGSEVRLEIDQLPYGEYGTLGARVVRISDDLAAPHEVQQALGDGHELAAPAFRVLLSITDRRAADDARVRLRSGMLMQVRYTLRRQRPITLVLEPLRKWLD
jgi:multidrug resistance efflux pump